MTNHMRFVTDLSKGILGEADSSELWTDIISHIPDELLLRPNLRILNLACGHGTPAVVLAKRMMALGIEKKVVQDSIWLLDKYMTFTGYVTKKFGFTNVITIDFLKWETDMKFDVVIGNPPYQNRAENSDGALWLQFVNKGFKYLKENGELIFITPTSWVGKVTNTAKANFDVFNKNHVKLFKPLSDKEVATYFNGVGSSFGYFIVSRGSGDTKLILENNMVEYYKLPVGEPLPNVLNQDSFSIHKKISILQKFEFVANYRMHSQVLKKKEIISDTQTDEFCYKTYYSHNLIRYSSKQHDLFGKIKVMIPIVGTIKNCWAEKNCNFTEDIRFVVVDNDTQAKNLVSILNSKFYQYIGTNYRSGRNLGFVLHFLPYLNYNKSWQDAEIYKHFNLTQAEISYVESIVK